MGLSEMHDAAPISPYPRALQRVAKPREHVTWTKQVTERIPSASHFSVHSWLSDEFHADLSAILAMLEAPPKQPQFWLPNPTMARSRRALRPRGTNEAK